MCLSDLSNVIATVIGVILGFGLSTGYGFVSVWQKRRHLRSQLREELRANLYSIPQKKSLIALILENLNKGRILPGESVHFQSRIYDEHFVDIGSSLNTKERSLVHLIYDYLAAVDKVLDGFEPAMAGKPEKAERKDLFRFYRVKLNDLLSLLDDSSNLLEKYLINNEVVDVFATDLPYDRVKTAEIINKEPGESSDTGDKL